MHPTCDDHGVGSGIGNGRVSFSDLPGNTRFLLVCGLVIAVLAAGVLSYIVSRRIPRESYSPLTAKGVFEAPQGLNRLQLAAQVILVNGRLWDATAQRLSHRVVLAGIAAILFAELVIGGSWPWRWFEGTTNRSARAAREGPPLRPRFVAPQAGVSRPSHPTDLSRVWPAYRFGPRMRRRAWQLPCAVLCGALIAAIMGPAMAMRFDLSDVPWSGVAEYMEHWLIVIAPADRLLHGAPLFKVARPAYGMLTTLLAVALQRGLGEFSLRDYCIYINCLQSLGLVLATLVYYRLAGRRWALCLLPLAFAALHLQFNTFYFSYPNHTAWRHVAFPVALLVFLLLRRARISVCAFGLGCSSSLALINNFETGVAITAGNLTYLIFRACSLETDRRLRPAFVLSTAWVAGAAAGLVGGLLCCRLVLGSFPDLAAAREQLAFVRTVSSNGIGSKPLGAFQPLALVMLAHAAFALIYSWFDRPRRRRWSTALRAGVSATILVWYAYYFNRPAPEYLMGFRLLYGCLLVDLLRLLTFARSPRLPDLPKLAALGIVGLVALIVLSQGRKQWPIYRRGLELIATPPSPSTATEIAGVTVPAGTRADMLLRKGRFVRDRAADGPVVYLTVDSYLIPKETGVWPALSIADIFWESITERKYETVLREIRTAPVSEIYVDDPESVREPGGEPETNWMGHLRYPAEFFRFVRRDLQSDFELIGVREGWEVWRRRPKDH